MEVEGLKRRQNTSTYILGTEEPVLILDEQEQEQVLETLRAENERANTFFKHILAFFSGMCSVLYFVFLYELTSSGRFSLIPFPTSLPHYSATPFPILSTLLCIFALLYSIWILQSQQTTRFQLWWAIPMCILVVESVALYWIRNFEEVFVSLENLKYKLKGA
ncbi:hypothetical protein G9A89_007365 [Geosiphon pyriformis]|nr:hypothetical protein G9A89_007365 [Geosiphon pyriformis]